MADRAVLVQRDDQLVEFWFDPACPFCWMTARWIVSIQEQRSITIDWQSISLLFKNGTPPESPYDAGAARTRDLLRVVESLRAGGAGDGIGAFYAAVGQRIHHEGTRDFDVAEILDSLGLDRDHAKALDDESFDAAIRASMARGLALTGPDVGTPLIAIDGPSGRAGLFGPVITEMPKGDDALRLWDGFVAMAATPGFFELKRTRTAGPDMTTIGA